MRWASESWEAKHDRLGQWHRWFAWRPVRVGEQIAWLETVERRGEWGPMRGFPPSIPWLWEYRVVQAEEWGDERSGRGSEVGVSAR
jgi:hypothetical protein